MNFKDVKEGFNKIKEGYLNPPETNYDKTEHLKKLAIIVIIVLVLALLSTLLNKYTTKKRDERIDSHSHTNQVNTTLTENKTQSN